MGNLSDDIVKYKKGELSPEQMHAMEKRALADPFLADALEGIEAISGENLAEDISSINKKIQGTRRTILLTPLRIAAGIIFIAASVFLIYQFAPERKTLALNKEEAKTKNTVEAEKQNAGSGASQKTDSDQHTKSEKLSVESPGPKVKVIEQKPKYSSPEIRQPAVKGQPSPVVQPIQQSVQDVASLAEPKPLKDNGDAAKIELEEMKAKEVVRDDARAAGRSVAAEKKNESLAFSGAQPSIQSAVKMHSQIIKGRVLSAEDNSPLPGVAVLLKGTAEGTVTDEEGNYKIQTDSINQRLAFSFIGFHTEEINTSGRDKIDVQLKGDVSQLSEIVVTGMGVAKDDRDEPVMKWAEPEGGRKAYDKYLESSVRYPDEALKNKIKGKSGIEFTVGLDGGLSDFRVFKKLGYGCEEEVIRLVKEGPRWNPTTEDNKPVESIVRVRLRFDPSKSGK